MPLSNFHTRKEGICVRLIPSIHCVPTVVRTSIHLPQSERRKCACSVQRGSERQEQWVQASPDVHIKPKSLWRLLHHLAELLISDALLRAIAPLGNQLPPVRVLEHLLCVRVCVDERVEPRAYGCVRVFSRRLCAKCVRLGVCACARVLQAPLRVFGCMGEWKRVRMGVSARAVLEHLLCVRVWMHG